MTYWKTPNFKELQKAWYERLAGEGFRDAEKIIGDELELQQSAAHPCRHYSQLRKQIKEAYYNLLSQYVEMAEFKTETDKLILTWYAEGMRIKCIREELHKIGRSKDRGTIRFTIRKYEVAWGMRSYLPNQIR